MFLIICDLMLFGFLLAVPNLLLIVFARRSWRFKLANFGVFIIYIVPYISLFGGWKWPASHRSLFVMPIAEMSHFFYLLLWQKVRLVKAWEVAKFTASLFVMTVICTIVWQDVVTKYLYDNTDDNMAGFFSPFFGDFWVGEGNSLVVAVPHVVHGRSMSDPDEIKQGWSIPKLCCLWCSFVVVSLVISILFARTPVIPGRQTIPGNGHPPDATS